jgi:hypothetical protein
MADVACHSRGLQSKMWHSRPEHMHTKENKPAAEQLACSGPQTCRLRAVHLQPKSIEPLAQLWATPRPVRSPELLRSRRPDLRSALLHPGWTTGVWTPAGDDCLQGCPCSPMEHMHVTVALITDACDCCSSHSRPVSDERRVAKNSRW